MTNLTVLLGKHMIWLVVSSVQLMDQFQIHGLHYVVLSLRGVYVLSHIVKHY